MNERKIALFDMDGVLVDYHTSLLNAMNSLMSPSEKPSNVFANKRPAYLENRKQLIISQPEWWIKLPVIKSGIELLHLCERIGFEIAILTKGPVRSTTAWSAKVEWIKKNLGYLPTMIVTTDKSLVYGRVLVDDYSDYVFGWLEHRPRGLALMPENKETLKLEHKNIMLYEPNYFHKPLSMQPQIVEALENAFRRK
jgi:5'(3')-deoxyribonucleotidase